MPRSFYLWQPGGPRSEYLVYVVTTTEQARRLLAIRPSATHISAKRAHALGWQAQRAAKYRGYWGVGGYVMDFDAPNPRNAEEAVAGAIRATARLTDAEAGVWEGQVAAMEAALAVLVGDSPVTLDTESTP